MTPRDIGLSADGNTVYAGYSLLGYATAYQVGKGRLFNHQTPIAYSSDNPFKWDSFKDSDRNLKVSPDGKIAIVAAGANGIIAYNTTTNTELWRIDGEASNRPRGALHPEVAFSPDSRYVLLAPYQNQGSPTRVNIPVKVAEWDSKRNRYNKKKMLDKNYSTTGQIRKQSLMLVEAQTGRVKWERLTSAELFDTQSGAKVWSYRKAPNGLSQ